MNSVFLSPFSVVRRAAPWLALWTAALVTLVALLIRQDRHEARAVALAEAKAIFQKDLVFRLWNADMGGVYVPVTAATQPNPYLAQVPLRDVATTAGQALTLVNPAYMTRMVHELGAEEFAMKGHITSLKPIRAGNAPDPWERAMLERFDQGLREGHGIAPMQGQDHFRYMGALVTQERCLKCHAHQGYKVGEVRGGISVSIPFEGHSVLGILARHRLLLGGLWLLWAVGLGGIAVIFLRTEDAQRALAERSLLAAQLNQSQKLEAMGQLAGGVAHDINNMLTAVLGHAELLKGKLAPGDPLLFHVLGTEKAAMRSRGIVAQLLAFSRKSLMQAVALDPAAHLRELARTLAPLIGEHIQMEVQAAPGLWKIWFDPSQLDQIVMNLAINARDAMPAGGRLTLALANVRVDESFRAHHLDATPGPHVLLAIRDTGCGMDRATQDRLFEPFFTTKGVGRGTGLGLATVFGILKQAKGFITVYSEPGQGSEFKVYLPVSEGEAPRLAQEPSAPVLARRQVLLVEDDPVLREVIALMLKDLGQEVRVASGAQEALALLADEACPVQVMVSDMVMPGMGGLELRERVLELRPGLGVILMSGYAPEAILHQRILADGVVFLNKPFTSQDLAHKLAGA